MTPAEWAAKYLTHRRNNEEARATLIRLDAMRALSEDEYREFEALIDAGVEEENL